MNIFKNKKSVVVLFVIIFWALYSITSVTVFFYNVTEVYQNEVERQKSWIRYQSDLGMNFLVSKQIDFLKDNLQQAMYMHQIDFGILMLPEQEPFYVVRQGQVELAEKYEPTEDVEQIGDLYYKTIQIRDATLTVGIQHDAWVFIKSYFQVYASKIAFDILLITLISFALIHFILRDLIQLTQILSSRSAKKLKNIKIQSLEAQILSAATQEYESMAKDLSWEAQVFSTSLGAAITTELRRGTPVPSSFQAALVRIDLNQYTQKFLSTDLSTMINTLNRYFALAREIIERYDGLIYEYVGDEILFFFKDEQQNKNLTIRKATQCIRDIFIEVETNKFENFTLKSSISYGVLNFIKLDQGHAFSGVPLIESARLLAQISNKQINSMIIHTDAYDYIKDLSEQSSDQDYALKGFDGAQSLTEIHKFKRIETASLDIFENRGSLYIADILLEIAKDKIPSEITFQTLNALRSINIQNPSLRMENNFISLLSQQYSKLKTEQTESNSEEQTQNKKNISLLISLCNKMVSRENYSNDLQGLLLKLEKHIQDPRLLANILLTRSHFEEQMDIKIDQSHRRSNRLWADALFVLGKNSVDKYIIREIRWMLAQENINFHLSAHYLCSALLQYHRDMDAIYFKTNPYFSELKSILQKSLKNQNKEITKFAERYQTLTGDIL